MAHFRLVQGKNMDLVIAEVCPKRIIIMGINRLIWQLTSLPWVRTVLLFPKFIHQKWPNRLKKMNFIPHMFGFNSGSSAFESKIHLRFFIIWYNSYFFYFQLYKTFLISSRGKHFDWKFLISTTSVLIQRILDLHFKNSGIDNIVNLHPSIIVLRSSEHEKPIVVSYSTLCFIEIKPRDIWRVFVLFLDIFTRRCWVFDWSYSKRFYIH